jgi:hypothetical protein
MAILSLESSNHPEDTGIGLESVVFPFATGALRGDCEPFGPNHAMCIIEVVRKEAIRATFWTNRFRPDPFSDTHVQRNIKLEALKPWLFVCESFLITSDRFVMSATGLSKR